MIGSKRFQVLTIVLIYVIYSLIFIITTRYDNDVSFEGDELFFQSIAVNFACGHGFPKAGGLEKFNVYKFNLRNVHDPCPSTILFKNSAGPYTFVKHPMYPLLIGLIYKLTGINPCIIKWFQLFIFILVAAFLPWLGFKFRGKEGYYCGLIASPFFLFFNYLSARVLYAEPLIVLFLFLITAGYIWYSEKQNILSSVVLGVILGFSLLLKGSLIFVPILLFISLLFKYKKLRMNNPVIHVILMMFSMIIIITPWSLYANIKNRDNVLKVKKSIEILTDKNLSENYKKAFIDSSSLIYVNTKIYPLFLASANNVREALLSGAVPAEQANLYVDNSTVAEKTVWQKFYLQSNRFIMFSVQSPMLLIDGNCEFYPSKAGIEGSDGGGNVWWGRRTSCSYYHDNMEDKPVILRVLNFYQHFPGHIFKIFAYKISLGLFRMMFLWVIIYLFFLETIRNLLRKIIKNQVIFKILAITGLFYLIFIFNPPVPSGNSVLFYSIVVAISAISLIVNLKRGFEDILFNAPLIFYIIFFNFIFISFIIFGFERQNNVMNFLLTLIAFYYLCRFIRGKSGIIKLRKIV